MRQQAGYVSLLFVLFTLSLSANNHVEAYISTYKDIAQREMQRSNIPASIILAQGIHESAWGKGDLALNSKNHFGIKCKDYWTGPTFYIEDDDYENGKLIKSCFRSYENVESSYIDHTNFLLEGDRYQGLFLYDPTDYKNWAKGLKQCGYATDPHYASKLIRIIETHQLYLFDIFKAPMKPILEAPTFFIPTEFLNSTEIVDPVVYAYEPSEAPVPFSINQDNEIEPASNFDYEVATEQEVTLVPNMEAIREEEEIVYTAPSSSININAIEQGQHNMTAVIPTSTSRDKRIKNLGRKPRVSSGGGPR